MIQALLSIFYPRICLSCNELLLEKESLICSECYHHLTFTSMHLNPHNALYQLFYGRIQLEHASSILYFNKSNVTHNIIHQLKYKGAEEIGSLLGSLYDEQLLVIQENAKFDLVVPVPLHPKKLKQRGYNQLTTFGKEISNILNIPFEEHLLLKQKETTTQTIKKKDERTKMDNEIFLLSHPEKFVNKHILLIDDVVTTGSTLENALNVLSKIEQVKLSIITMAMTDHS
ncbi:MAG: ComF family protein [Flavobacterium sp.]